MTKKANSVKINYIYNVAYQLLLILAPLITSPYISRKLGPDMIGQQSYCYSIATYFMLFIMLGVANYGNRCVAKVRENRKELSQTFWTIYGFQCLRAIVVLTTYILFVLFFEQKYSLIALVNGIYVFSGFFDISWLFFGLEQFRLTVPVNFIVKIFNIIALLLFIRQPSDIWKYSLIIGSVALISNCILWFYLKRFVDWYKPSFKEFLPHIKPEIILFVPVIAVSLYKVMDRIMLGALSTSTEVGFYTQAESIVNLPMSLITSLGTVMLPRISHLISKGDIDSTKKYIESSISFAMMLAFAMAFGLSAIAPTFAPTFFGEEYVPCSALIIGLSITIIFISWANIIRTQYLIPNAKDKSYLISIVTGAIVNLCINFSLIPRFASIGAVVGTVCAEGVVCFIQTFMVHKELPIKKYINIASPFFIMGIVMFGAVRGVSVLIQQPYLQIGMQLLVGIAVYGGLLIIYSYMFDSFVAKTIQNILKRVLK